MRKAIVLGALIAGCATGKAAGPNSPSSTFQTVGTDGYDVAYLAEVAREAGCTDSNRAVCCEEIAKGAREAAVAGDELEASHRYHVLAISCAAHRGSATLAVQSTPAPTSKAEGSVWATVNLVPQIPTHFRIYWVSASTGYQLLPARLPKRMHMVDFEIHLLAVDGPDASRVIVVKQALPIDFASHAQQSMQIRVKENPDPLSEGIAFEIVPLPMRIDPPQPQKAAIPTALLESVGPMRLPPEFQFGNSLPSAWVRACLDPTGAITGIGLLSPVHPRLAGAIIESLGRGQGRPIKQDGKSISTCAPLHVDFVSAEGGRK